MYISVIIPVYNAEKYVKRAVLSALAQPETGEVILVDDASTDNSFNVCQQLASIYEKVNLFLHDDGKNHGPGATRNIGIQNARLSYVAFLDADDYYSKTIFSNALKVIKSNESIDGVYGVLKNEFISETIRDEFLNEIRLPLFYCIEESIPPNLLIGYLLKGEGGFFSIISMVIKKEFFKKCGLFPENMRRAEDVDLIFRMCMSGKLVPFGDKTNVAVYRLVHGKNSIYANHKKDRIRLYENNLKYSMKQNVREYIPRRLMILRASLYCSSVNSEGNKLWWQIIMLLNCLRIIYKTPRLIFYIF